MLARHLKWYNYVNSTISNKSSEINNDFVNHEHNDYYFNIIMVTSILMLLFIVGLRIRKTRILHIIKQNQLPSNKKDIEYNTKYHIIDHIIINVLPNTFYNISPMNYFEKFGIYKRKVKNNEMKDERENEFEYLKKIV